MRRRGFETVSVDDLASVRESDGEGVALSVAERVVVLEAEPLIERVRETADVADIVCVRRLRVTDAESEVVAVVESDRERCQDEELENVARERVRDIVFVGVGLEWVRLVSAVKDCDSESCCDCVVVGVGVDVKDAVSSRVGVGTTDNDGDAVAETVEDSTGALADADTLDSDMVMAFETERLPVGDGVRASDAVVDTSLEGLNVRELVRGDVGEVDPDWLTLWVKTGDGVSERVPLGSPGVTVALRFPDSVTVAMGEVVGLDDTAVRDVLRERPSVAEAEMEKRES